MNACTIIAKNYVAFARVLARSFAEQHPGSRLAVLIIDDYEGYIDPEQEPFDILTPAAVGCDAFLEMALRYTILELSTAVKPWLMRYLLETTSGPVTYLDPDIRVFSSLERLDQLATERGLVLTPHNSTPVPPDGRRPTQIDIMIAGVYNLGYVTLAPRAEIDALLDWWSDRLLRDCRVDPIWGYFVDQRWFDLAPGLVSDLAILRDPEFNVAYWNLHGRALAVGSDGYTVDGRPLAFFHFSGFDPRSPLVLSRHQDRVDVTREPALERILGEYARALLEEGHAVSSAWPYGFGAFGDGSPLDADLRRAYDEFLDEFKAAGRPVPSPFGLEGVQEFDAWLAGQAPGMAPGVSRALARAYAKRPDLRELYTGPTPEGGAQLIQWGRIYGPRENAMIARSQRSSHRIDLSLDPANEVGLALTEPLPDGPWGVNVVGHFRSDDAGGTLARGVVAALDRAGVPALPVQSPTATTAGRVEYRAEGVEDPPFPANLLCLDGPAAAGFARDAGSGMFEGHYSIGVWAPDTGEAPGPWRPALALLDELWVPSAYVADGMSRITDLPLITVPVPVTGAEPGSVSRSDLGLPADGPVLLVRHDCADDWDARNPAAAIEAFRASGAAAAGATLVVRVVNASRSPRHHALLRDAARGGSVRVIDGLLSEAHDDGLLRLADGVLSLHRGVGFGIDLARAMWHGTPVIATGYGGNLDYMDDETAMLVAHRLVSVGAAGEGLSERARWAEPDIADAARRITQLVADPAGAAETGERGRQVVRERYSPQAAGVALARRLEQVRSLGRVRSTMPAAPGGGPAVTALPGAVAAPPRAAAPGRGRRVRQVARQGLLRVMRPVTADQGAVNRALLAAVEELGESLSDLRREDGARRAAMLATLRRHDDLVPLAEAQIAKLDELKRMTTLSTDRSVYMALAELGRRHGAAAAQIECVRDASLAGSELRAFSQNGEDGVIAEILRRIGADTRWFVEFGIESGREGNCVYLADVAGWHGLFIEADSAHFDALSGKYAVQPAITTIKSFVSAGNIEELLAAAGVPAELDILSIDVDGQDFWIWEGIRAYRPRVVIIEYNSALDPERRLVQPRDPTWVWDGSDYFGASLGALVSLGEQKGYQLVHTELSGANAFFVRADLAADRFAAPEMVSKRGHPNYFQSGHVHPPSHGRRHYIDLDRQPLA